MKNKIALLSIIGILLISGCVQQEERPDNGTKDNTALCGCEFVNVYGVSYSEDSLSMIIENTGRIPICDSSVRVIYSDGSVDVLDTYPKITTDARLNVGESKNVVVGNVKSNIRKVRLMCGNNPFEINAEEIQGLQ